MNENGIYNVVVDTTTGGNYTPSKTANFYDWTWPYKPDNTYWGNWTVSYPTTIYMYQIQCPKCETMNWLKLDTITPCHKCLAKLKAVSEQAEYEIEIK